MGKKETKPQRSLVKKLIILIITDIFLIYTPQGEVNAYMEGDSASVILVGFAELDISPEIGMEMPGGYIKSHFTSFHDPCKVRAAVFDDGKKATAIIGIDAGFIPRSIVETVRIGIQARCGIPGESILIGASHSHSSGPVGLVMPGEYDHASPFVQSLAYDRSSLGDSQYIKMVECQLVEVVCKAWLARTDCEVGAGKGIEDKVSFNRRFRMKNGMTFTHPGQLNPDILEPAGPIDPEVGVVGVWNKKGKCTGCIVNYACHATTNPVPGAVSANWIYYMEQTIRGAMGSDCIVVFTQGTSGDVTQVNNLNPFIYLQGEDWSRFVGGRVGAEVVKVLLSMPRGAMSTVDSRLRVMDIKRRIPDPDRVRACYKLVRESPEKVGETMWVFAKEIVLLDALLKKGPTAKVEVQAIQVGPAVFVSNPAELFCELGLEIKNKSPFKFTFPVELANGCVGYVPTEEAFGSHGGGYETRLTSLSNLEPTAGNKIVTAGLELIRQMKPGKEPEFEKGHPAGPWGYDSGSWDYGNVKPELK